MTAKYRVGILEDDELVRDAIARLLALWGHDVVAAPSSKDLLIQVETGPLHLTIADYRLGNRENGIGAIGNVVEALGKTIPAIVITGDTTSAVRAEIEAAGHEVLHKPAVASEMRVLLDRLLEAR